MRSFVNKGGRSDPIFGRKASILVPPLVPERYRCSKMRGSVYLQNCKRFFLPSSSSVFAHSLSQLEDENLKFQEDITSNVRQFDENEKKSVSLLDALDEVGISFELRGFCSADMQALLDWERLQMDDDTEQWARDTQIPSISDPTTIV